MKEALEADIGKDTLESLYCTESRSLAVPETGKIAVKVINQYGDEAIKAFAV